MDSLFSIPLLFSISLCLLIFLLLKPKTNHSKSSLRFPPGPRPLPFVGNIHNLIGSLPHCTLQKLSRQYGPFMLLQLGESPTIIVSSPDAAREIMKTHDVNFATRPISTTVGIFTFGGMGTIFPPYGEYWRQMRKICVLELLSNRRVQSFRSIREGEVGNLIQYLNSCASHRVPVNISKRLASMANDIIMRSIVGSKSKNQDVFLRDLDATVKLSGFNLVNMFPSSRLARLVSNAVKKTERTQLSRVSFSDEVIKEHRERKIATGEGEMEDMLSTLLRLHDENTVTNSLDMVSVKAVVLDLFGAGSETSSTTLEWSCPSS
ncbi:hypothetical protein LUZ61_000631 [Rhynchospora tenuis]|uniref:Cytochrome P450 n=1 Tax=Rhynchospora tenuis TaxID=198213 RepID=A0AAD6EQ24_9POAL|nr:hypothetical protein LUZ61_000631 [Rhynchospora tenuis]